MSHLQAHPGFLWPDPLRLERVDAAALSWPTHIQLEHGPPWDVHM
jgi:hypothetical protein